MKIGFVIGTLSYSGAEKIMFHLIKSFDNGQNKVSVFLLSSTTKCEELGTSVQQIPLYDPVMECNHGKIVRTIKRQRSIRRYIQQNTQDIIMSFGVIFNVDLLEACRGLNVPIIVCERNDPYNDPHSKLLRVRRKLSYPLASGYVFQTKEIQEFFPYSIRRKSIVIPNFIEDKVDVSQKYNPQRTVFATSARLDNRQKDQINLIKAFALFSKNHSDYSLEFYGGGPDEKLLKNECVNQGVVDKVVFKGRVNNPMQYIRTAKAFILSSVYEGMPNSLIEAMCYGMPCISSDCSGGGAKALITNEVDGILYPVGDVNALCSAMEKIASNTTFAQTLGENAYKLNDKLYIENIIPLWNKYISEVYEKSHINK